MRLHNLNVGDRRWLEYLLNEAHRAQRRAYAPYSKFKVGAVILCSNGDVFEGCNVECADYDGTHAEEAALAMMVMRGRLDPMRLMVIGGLNGQEKPAAPCGKCRQKLMEFARAAGAYRDLRVYVKPDGDWKIALLSEMLPWAFGPSVLGVQTTKRKSPW